ncbi:HEAT repeat domain-containing protein [Vibrio aerogenes]|nr:HEAT repeat domain-containing protein [Vibrio aerogenes]
MALMNNEVRRKDRGQALPAVSPEVNPVYKGSSFRQVLQGFIGQLEKGQFSQNELEAIQNSIQANEEAAGLVMEAILASGTSYDTKSVLVEMLSLRNDSLTMNFAMELLQNPDHPMQALGGDLASRIIRNGRASQMLESVIWGNYPPETQQIVQSVIQSVGNISVDDHDKEQVAHLLDDYMINGGESFRPAALTSLAALEANDPEALNQLADRYLDDKNEDIRLAAIQTLYNMENGQLSADVQSKLLEISNDTNQSYYIRSAALQILGDFVESHRKNLQ